MVAEETRLLTACSDQELLMFKLSQERAEGGEGEGEGEGEVVRGKRKAEAGGEDTSTVKVGHTSSVSEWITMKLLVVCRLLCTPS